MPSSTPAHKQSRTAYWAMLALGILVSSMFGFFVLWMHVLEPRKAEAQQSWSTIDATVIHAVVAPMRLRRGLQWTHEFTYRFSLPGGKSHVGYFQRGTWSDRDNAQNDLPKTGHQIPVWYDPENPDNNTHFRLSTSTRMDIGSLIAALIPITCGAVVAAISAVMLLRGERLS